MKDIKTGPYLCVNSDGWAEVYAGYVYSYEYMYSIGFSWAINNIDNVDYTRGSEFCESFIDLSQDNTLTKLEKLIYKIS